MEDILTRTAAERFAIPYLYPYQRLVAVNILEALGYFGDKRRQEAARFQMVILPTGAGKSLCFTLPTEIIGGITLAIYPLLSLMGDQKRRLDELGIPSIMLRGGQDSRQRSSLISSLPSGQGGFILTNPETLEAPGVLDLLAGCSILHGVIDEAHTVIHWGESFRPSYLALGSRLRALHIPVVTAFTATASPAMIPKLRRYLFQDSSMHVVRGDPDRPNITYQVMPTISRLHDLTRLAHPDTGVPRPALCFCPTRRLTEEIAAVLLDRLGDSSIRYYHAGLSKAEKQLLEAWFFRHTSALLCATTAYGLGVDKPDIRSVIHVSAPPTVEAYLQETGRCGRDGDLSRAVLLADRFGQQTNRSPLLHALGDHSRCRREQLLGLMGSSTDSCSGCDVCSSTFTLHADGEPQLLRAISAHPRRHTVSRWAVLLSGSGAGWPWNYALIRYRNLPDMGSWYHQDIRQALQRLIAAGLITADRRGPWKGLLYCP